jgi:hypothetical protein
LLAMPPLSQTGCQDGHKQKPPEETGGRRSVR